LPLPIRPDLVFLDLECRSAEQVIGALAERAAGAAGLRSCARDLEHALADRERLGSTAIGGGVAIPHAKVAGLKQPLLAVGVCRSGVDFGATDGQPVRVFFLIASPPDAPAEHLRLLAAISRWLGKGGDRVQAVAHAATPADAAALLAETPA
jgi:PTS system nitrogen regulatory IIA component